MFLRYIFMIQQIYQRLQISPATLAKFCQQWQITELAVFGSILRDDFNLNSDIDILVTFHPEARITLFGLETIEIGFQKLFQRPVDLVTKRAIERSHNWIRRQNILGNAKTIMSQDHEILLDLDRACRLILNFTAGTTKDDFENDLKTQSSVLYQIIIIGEAVNRLSEAFKKAYPEIPYAEIRGMRNRITHEYKDVDMDVIWDAMTTDIPSLINAIAPLLLPENADL